MMIFSFLNKSLESQTVTQRSEVGALNLQRCLNTLPYLHSALIHHIFGVAGNTSGIEEKPSRKSRGKMFTDALIVLLTTSFYVAPDAHRKLIKFLPLRSRSLS